MFPVQTSIANNFLLVKVRFISLTMLFNDSICIDNFYSSRMHLSPATDTSPQFSVYLKIPMPMSFQKSLYSNHAGCQVSRWPFMI